MPLSTELLSEQLQIADALLVGRQKIREPQDLPGRYGRVVKALENPDLVDEVALHLDKVHPDYTKRFAELAERSRE